MSFEIIMKAVLPVYLLTGIGFILHRLKVIQPEMEKGLLKLVIHCLYPCLILDKTLGNSLVRQPEVVGWGIGLGLGLVCCGMLVATMMGAFLGLKPGQGKRTFSLAAGVQNYGYMAIPILAALFVVGDHDEVFGVLFVHSLGVEIGIWCIGLMVMTGSFLKSPKQLINGPIVAVVLGIALSWTDAWQFFDLKSGPMVGSIIRQAMSWLGVCAFPLGILLIGSTMADLVGKKKMSLRIGVAGILVRVVIMPCVILAAAYYLPIVTSLKQVLVVQASMPAAVTPIIVARHYGGSSGTAVQVVVATSVVALLTMPLWISWGVGFLF
ncbi:MAG: AEC family transporter [Akkermansiaceae bacterium]